MRKDLRGIVFIATVLLSSVVLFGKVNPIIKKSSTFTELGKPLPYDLVPKGIYDVIFSSFASNDSEEVAYAVVVSHENNGVIFVETTKMEYRPAVYRTYKVEIVQGQSVWTLLSGKSTKPEQKQNKSDAPPRRIAFSFKSKKII